MKRAWLIWASVTALISAYCFAGLVAAWPATTKLKLETGAFLELKVFRLGTSPLAMELRFRRAQRDKRPELGHWSPRSDELGRGRSVLKFDNPGAAIRVLASSKDSLPLIFEAMPASAHAVESISRTLTSSPSIEKGVWPWPVEDTPKLVLHRGLNSIKVEVDLVEPPLVGEIVDLIVSPELSFKHTGTAGLEWLWLSFFWPVFAAIQLIWVLILLIVGSWKSRTSAKRV